jgi:hypothetical protein
VVAPKPAASARKAASTAAVPRAYHTKSKPKASSAYTHSSNAFAGCRRLYLTLFDRLLFFFLLFSFSFLFLFFSFPLFLSLSLSLCLSLSAASKGKKQQPQQREASSSESGVSQSSQAAQPQPVSSPEY